MNAIISGLIVLTILNVLGELRRKVLVRARNYVDASNFINGIHQMFNVIYPISFLFFNFPGTLSSE